MRIGETVMGHLSQMFDEIEAAVRLFTDDLWRREGAKDLMMVPAFLAHHMIWCIRLRHLLDITQDKLPPDPAKGRYSRQCIPQQEQLLSLLDAVRSYSAAVYGKMDDETYIGEATSSDPIGRVMYTIAHTRHHLGQLVQILKENGIKPPKWYPR
jgi:hypothetical protein